MKSSLIPLVALLSFTLACSSTERAAANLAATAAQDVPQQVPQQKLAETRTVGFSDLDRTGVPAEPVERKIIRNADITIEVASTTDAQHRVTSIAESHGGFVVTSEAKQRESADPSQRSVDIKLVVRVPSTEFGLALEEIKKLATNTPQEQVSGQDVTEEFIDLEARIKSQKALEVQFLGIMRQATKVEDALEVQRQLAEVRTEIERLEGRKRFLENRASLSTITVQIQAPKPILAVTGTTFGQDLREAFSESIGVASDIVLFLIRFLIVMTPVALFVLLPAGLAIRFLVRRAHRIRLAQSLAAQTE